MQQKVHFIDWTNSAFSLKKIDVIFSCKAEKLNIVPNDVAFNMICFSGAALYEEIKSGQILICLYCT